MFVVVALGCGGSSSPKPATNVGPPAQLTAAPADANDPIVASVNGKPVYGSCVQKQAARGATKQVALNECIDFELLAQQAEQFATDAEVVLATRTALVSELVARDYEDKFTRPADFGPFWDRIIERNKQRIEHGEFRASAYLRIKVPENASPEQEAKAKALSEELAAAVANERGIMHQHVADLGKQILGDRATLDVAVVPPYLKEGLEPNYANALFAIEEVGRASGAVRTKWGWDVIFFTDVVPAEKLTPEQIVESVLPDVKRSYFPQWATQVAQRLGLSIKIYDENVPKLEDLP